MIVGDFNGDGKLDLADSQPTTGVISVLLGNGDGTFGAPIANPVNLSGITVQAMIGADFNKDGKDDLAAVFTSGSSSSPLYAFTSNGDGTFQPHLVDNLPIQAFNLAAGDFNHDGNLDLVALDYSGAVNPSVFVYLGKGDGTFSGPVMYSTGSLFTNTVQSADFNGDGKVDVTVGTEQGLFFFARNGDGTFMPFVETRCPSASWPASSETLTVTTSPTWQ
jgi:FG-GAP-like repeat